MPSKENVVTSIKKSLSCTSCPIVKLHGKNTPSESLIQFENQIVNHNCPHQHCQIFLPRLGHPGPPHPDLHVRICDVRAAPQLGEAPFLVGEIARWADVDQQFAVQEHFVTHCYLLNFYVLSVFSEMRMTLVDKRQADDVKVKTACCIAAGIVFIFDSIQTGER